MSLYDENQRICKICPYCKHFVSETEDMEPECNVDEDYTLEDYCECYERKGN